MEEANLVLDYVQVLVWPLLVIAVALVVIQLTLRGFPRRLEKSALRLDVPWVGHDKTARVNMALEDSEWLASLGGNPPPNPAVHLQQAIQVRPSSYRESARQISESLQRGNVVILDLAGANEDIAARLIDFCSATTLAKNGVLQQLSSTVLLLIPHSD